jgi:hypothetical protein
MRGFTLRALPVCFVALVVGCFSTSGSVGTNKSGLPPSATHAYWHQVGAVLAQKATSSEFSDNVKLIRLQTSSLRAISQEGVDQTLVLAVDDVIRAEEEVLRVAEMANNDVGIMRANQATAKEFADANRRAAEAKKHLKGLRDSLNARLNGGFGPIG